MADGSDKSDHADVRRHTFTEYADAGFLSDVIPILPHDAVLSSASAVDEKQRGKIPGQWKHKDQAWVGLHDWATSTYTLDDLKKWSRWPACSIGIRTQRIPTVDIDCELPEIVEEVVALLTALLGDAPKRGRANTCRLAMPYFLADGETAPGKIRIAFQQPGNTDKKQIYAVEFLAEGQQFVVEGIHPSGVPYEWEGGFDLVEVTRAGLTPVTNREWIDAANAVEDLLTTRGMEIVRRHDSGGSSDDLPLGDDKTAARDPDEAVAALFALTVENIAYDHFISILHAYKAAVRGSEDYWEQFRDWALQFPGAEEAYLRAKWDSVTASSIGASWLYAEARKTGWDGGVDDLPEIAQTPEEKAHDEKKRARDERQSAYNEQASKLPNIAVRDGDFVHVLDEAELALIDSSVQVFAHSGRVAQLVEEPIETRHGETVKQPAMKTVTPTHMAELFERTARFWKLKDKDWKPAQCPSEIAKRYIDRAGEWKVPLCTGLTSVPPLRRDGSLHLTPGHDPVTGLIYTPSGLVIPRDMPEQPTKDDAYRWLDILCTELLPGFRFQGSEPGTPNIYRSAALSHLLTPLAMAILEHAVAHLFSAPEAGSGKGLLVDMLSMILFGHKATVMQYSHAPEELEKKFDSVILKGSRHVFLDNVEPGTPVGGDTLSMMMTQDSKAVRVLGLSKIVEASLKGLYVTATGNNLSVENDFTRRAILAYIDPGCSNPEARQFPFEPCERIALDRGRYFAAAVTPLRAFLLAGCPQKVPELGSFDPWNQLVCGTLAWLGQPNPVETQAELKRTSPDRDLSATVMQAIGDATYGVIGTFTAAELAELALSHDSLRGALLQVAQKGKFLEIDTHKLGCWLREKKNNFIGGYRVVDTKVVAHTGAVKWRIEKEAKRA